MTKTKRSTAATVADAFHRHYSQIWGEERWQSSLYPALCEPTRHACLVNQYAASSDVETYLNISSGTLEALLFPRSNVGSACQSLRKCFIKPQQANGPPVEHAVRITTDSSDFPAPVVSNTSLCTHWNLDAASALAASLLDVRPGDKVLDLCASPGGKSVVMSQDLWPHLRSPAQALQTDTPRTSYLHSNEADGRRQRRLADNLKAYLPKSLFDNSQVAALKIDGTLPKSEYELRVKLSDGKCVPYDKVLVDAPCSSERHIIHTHEKATASGRIAEEMTGWRPGTSKRLAKTQLQLLTTAMKVVKAGGTILYATCSIEPTENDGVIEKMLVQVEKERKKGTKWNFRVGFNEGAGDDELEAELQRGWAEKTRYGWIVLPDHPNGGRWGPLYFSILTKISG